MVAKHDSALTRWLSLDLENFGRNSNERRPPKNSRAIEAQLTRLEKEIIRLKQLLHECLGIEYLEKGRLSSLISNKEREAREYCRKLRITPENRLVALLEARYKPLSLEALSWRDEEENPLLAVFSPEEHWCGAGYICSPWQISHRHPGPVYLSPQAHAHPSNLPVEFVRRLYYKVYSRRHFRPIHCKFTGRISSRMRKVIRQARLEFKAVFIIAETSGWSSNQAEPPPTKGFLVTGWDGYHLWLLASKL